MDVKRRSSRIRLRLQYLKPRPGYLLALVLLLVVTFASASAMENGSNPDRKTSDQDRVLRRISTPTGEIIDLLPAQDAYIASNFPNQNYGQVDQLWVGYDLTRSGGGIERPYFSWMSGDIPSNIIINNAELWIYLTTSRPGNDSPMTVNVRHLINSWTEDTITWNNRAGVDWDSVVGQSMITNAGGWQSMDVTGIVKDWSSGAHANNGLIAMGYESPQDRERKFYSKEGPTGLQAFLRIDYDDSDDTVAPTASMEPFPQPIVASSTFDVSWIGEDEVNGSGIDFYDVQYDAGDDAGSWVNWLVHTSATTFEFQANDTSYEFRVRATDKAGNISPWSNPVSISVDTTPPQSTVLPFDPPIVQSNSFLVEWTGDDGPDGSGIQFFNIYSRRWNEPWVLWLSQTGDTSAMYNAPDDATYSFEATAVDNLGNAEVFTGNGEASVIVDNDPPFVEPYAFLPLIFREVP